MKDPDEITQQLLQSLEKNDALQRRHASFWNFYKKSSKELGIFSEIFDRFEHDYEAKIIKWGLCDNDPPDVYAKLTDGRLIGIEITELVNEAAIVAQINQSANYSTEQLRFDFDCATTELRQIIARKGTKLATVTGEYDEFALLVHTDELMLSSDQFTTNEHGITLDIAPIISRLYLLFSYDPNKQKCPLIRLA